MKPWLKWTLIVFGVFTVIAIVTEVMKSPEERAAEQAAAKAKKDSIQLVEQKRKDSTELADLESYAYLAGAQPFVAAGLKYPKTANFTLKPVYSEHIGGNVFDIRGKVEAKNAFGVPSDHFYAVKVKYTGGTSHSQASWKLVSIEMQ